MPSEIYTPFFEATCNVFALMLDLTSVSEHPSTSFVYSDSLNISIGVVGDLVGEVIYRFPLETSLNMVTIMSGMEMDEVDDFVSSAISEIANIISGNVLTSLAERDLRCDITPPVPSTGGEDKDYALRKECCLATSAGPVCLDIRLNPAQGITL